MEVFPSVHPSVRLPFSALIIHACLSHCEAWHHLPWSFDESWGEGVLRPKRITVVLFFFNIIYAYYIFLYTERVSIANILRTVIAHCDA